jgi:protein gp37
VSNKCSAARRGADGDIHIVHPAGSVPNHLVGLSPLWVLFGLARSIGGRDLMAESAIEWTEVTWNPTTGCDRTSPGCDNCYALTLARRLKAMGQPKYQLDGDPRTSGPGFGLTLHPDTLRLPYSWVKPRVVFVNSMSDLFHEAVPETYIRQVFEVMAATPQHTYQVLTKRSKRLARLAPMLEWPANVWMGVSVESQRYVFRVEHLRSVPAAVRFVSAEPLLGPVELDLSGIAWLIAGGESGHRARPIDPDWVRSLRDACVAVGTVFFFKQWGGPTPKAGGRELDGRTYDEIPSKPTLIGQE